MPWSGVKESLFHRFTDPSSFLLLVVGPGAPFVPSDRSVRSDARSPVRSFLFMRLDLHGEALHPIHFGQQRGLLFGHEHPLALRDHDA